MIRKRCNMFLFFPDFVNMKKMRDVRMIIFASESRWDLCYVSENEGFRFHEIHKYFGPLINRPPLLLITQISLPRGGSFIKAPRVKCYQDATLKMKVLLDSRRVHSLRKIWSHHIMQQQSTLLRETQKTATTNQQWLFACAHMPHPARPCIFASVLC